jgi:DNA-binding Xre family transcriptional regulator
MEESLKRLIKESGYKNKYLAEKLGITPNFLSMCKSGKRKLSDEKINSLKKLL